MSATNVPDSNDTSAILRDAYPEVPSMMPDGPRCQARLGDDICNAVEPLHRQGLGYIGGHPFAPAPAPSTDLASEDVMGIFERQFDEWLRAGKCEAEDREVLRVVWAHGAAAQRAVDGERKSR